MTKKPLNYPNSRRTELVEKLHGIDVPDPYRWLEDIDSEETRTWIEAQNELTYGFLEDVPAREEITKRLTELWDYEKFDVPHKRGGRYFFTHNDGLQNQSLLYWLDSLDGTPKVLLDPNTLSEDGTVALTGYTVSDDGKFLAYGISSAGSDWQEWHVREVDSGCDLDDTIEWVKWSEAAWSVDNRGFYYSRYDAPEEGKAYKGANYYHKLYYHKLGTSQSEDELIYERPDQKEWGFLAELADDYRYLIVEIWKGTHQENNIVYLDLQEPNAEMVELLMGFEASFIFLGNDGSNLFFHTDLDAPMKRVIAIDVTQPEREHWVEIIPEGDDALEIVSLVGDRLFAVYLHNAHSQVKTFGLQGNPISEIELPDMGTVTGFYGSRQDGETFYHFTGFTSPGTLFHYDLESDKSKVFRKPDLKFDPEDYVSKQIFYSSKDGTRIPMFITHKKGVELNGENPTYLYGYGGFNNPVPPSYSPAIMVWMMMGGVFAMANLRGGGEFGKEWHEAGMILTKQNVFDDFIAGAEWLIEHEITRTSKLAIGGRSNGGLLVGACMIQRPDLFGACLPVVGVLDMLRFHKFTIGWAWVSDYGSPDDEQEFKYLLGYSPYHNVKPGVEYPPTLISTGDHDDRVFPAHSFKFAAALQYAQVGANPVMIRIETRAGHGIGKPTTMMIAEAADRWAFLTSALDMGKNPFPS